MEYKVLRVLRILRVGIDDRGRPSMGLRNQGRGRSPGSRF